MTPYYSEDGITIYHGDCAEVVPMIKADCIVTDPPYGLGNIMNSPGYGSGRRSWALLWSDGAPPWDQSAPDIVTALPTLAKEVVIWGGNHFALPPARGWLVWDKIVRQFSSGHCELAWTNLAQPVRAYSYAHAQLASEGKYHPTQKPLPLMEWTIGFTSGATVLDPFMGSGTTLVAAKSAGRAAIGVEIEERYCEIAAKRLAQGVLPLEAS